MSVTTLDNSKCPISNLISSYCFPAAQLTAKKESQQNRKRETFWLTSLSCCSVSPHAECAGQQHQKPQHGLICATVKVCSSVSVLLLQTWFQQSFCLSSPALVFITPQTPTSPPITCAPLQTTTTLWLHNIVTPPHILHASIYVFSSSIVPKWND